MKHPKKIRYTKTTFTNEEREYLKKVFINIKRDKGWTVGQVAKTIGITQPSLSSYVNGKTPLNLKFVLLLAEALHLEPYDLVPELRLQFQRR